MRPLIRRKSRARHVTELIADSLAVDLTIDVALAADFGPRPTYEEPDPSENETWRCQHCRKVNYANGQRACDFCQLAAPPDHRDDPSYCCDSCEHLADRIREYGGVAAMDDHLAAWFEKQLEAIHR